MANLLAGKLWHSPALFPSARPSLLFVYQDRFLKPENTPLEQSKEKVNPGIALQRRCFVFPQYFLTLTNKYTITWLQGGPGPESSQLSCMVHPQLPVLLTALTLLHPQTLVTPCHRGEDPVRRRGYGAFTLCFWGCTPVSFMEISFRPIAAAGTPAMMY